jgi:hypothetical protein
VFAIKHEELCGALRLVAQSDNRVAAHHRFAQAFRALGHAYKASRRQLRVGIEHLEGVTNDLSRWIKAPAIIKDTAIQGL